MGNWAFHDRVGRADLSSDARAYGGISIAIVALHNLLDDVSAERFGRAAWIWDILYQRGVIAFDGIKFRPAYPVLPWIGVMAGGYCLGMVFDWDADRRRRFLVRLGLVLAAAFLVVRSVNVYGDLSVGVIKRRQFSRCSLFSMSQNIRLHSIFC